MGVGEGMHFSQSKSARLLNWYIINLILFNKELTVFPTCQQERSATGMFGYSD